ncbi:hypothetical protein ASE68_05430 [Agromyces sp. Leaf222]|nr:hypothetical protein ASE68_05430 [Agromyces sp. Leaf222]
MIQCALVVKYEGRWIVLVRLQRGSAIFLQRFACHAQDAAIEVLLHRHAKRRGVVRWQSPRGANRIEPEASSTREYSTVLHTVAEERRDVAHDLRITVKIDQIGDIARQLGLYDEPGESHGGQVGAVKLVMWNLEVSGTKLACLNTRVFGVRSEQFLRRAEEIFVDVDPINEDLSMSQSPVVDGLGSHQ